MRNMLILLVMVLGLSYGVAEPEQIMASNNVSTNTHGVGG
jgi:hypothetical protein